MWCFVTLAANGLTVTHAQTSTNQTDAPDLLYATIVLLFALLVFALFKWSVTRNRLRVNQQLMRIQSRTDELTQMLNRKYMEKRLFEVFELHLRQQQVNDVLIMIDVDEFKKVKVTHGHAAGDLVLQSVARLIFERFRNTDLCCRYGEHEYLVLLRDSGMENAQRIVEELRAKLANTLTSYEDQDIRVTCSIGLSAYSKNMVSCHDWIQQADLAAYEAKQQGGNQTATAAKHES